MKIHNPWADLIPTLLLNWSSSQSRSLAGTNASVLQPGDAPFSHLTAENTSHTLEITWPRCIYSVIYILICLFCDPKGEMLLFKEMFAVAEAFWKLLLFKQSRISVGFASKASHMPPSPVIPTTVSHPIHPRPLFPSLQQPNAGKVQSLGLTQSKVI